MKRDPALAFELADCRPGFIAVKSRLMTQSLTFRPAKESDVGALLDLYMHLSPESERCAPETARQSMARIAEIEGSAILVGALGDAILTSCTLVVIPNLTRGGRPYALIENVVTHPDHRRRGLGKAILDLATEQAWKHGCYKLMLSTGSANRAILSFYEGAGFEQSRTGFQKRNLPNRQEQTL